MPYAVWLPDVLRAAGLTVLTYPGWETRSSLSSKGIPAGPLSTDRPAVLWHHDASPPGDSPGALRWMRDQLDRPGQATANIWVDRYGVWHIIAAGVTWHAGNVNDGRWSNYQSLGVETDHTVGENWPDSLIASLRLGTAAILRHVDRSPDDALNFHRHVNADKRDPDGLDLNYERAAVAALITNPAPQEDDMTPEQAAQLQRVENLLTTGRADRSIGSAQWPWTFGYWTEALQAKVDAANATITAQAATIKALAAATGGDPAAIEAAVKDAVNKALDGLRITADGAK